MFKDKKILTAKLIGILGAINVFLGAFHFFVLPEMLNWETELIKLSSVSQATVNVLNIFMGILFIGFGILSFIYLSQIKKGDRTAWTFCLFLGIIWLIRTIMEPIYYGISVEEIAFTFFLLLVSLLYLIPLTIFRNEFIKK